MKRTKKGFTLVELLVVIAIIAIIAAVAVPVTIGQINKSKEKTAVNEMTNIVGAINTAYGEMATGTTMSQGKLAEFIEISNVEYVESFTITSGKTVLFKLKDGAPTLSDEERTFTLDVVDISINSAGSNIYTVAANGTVEYKAPSAG